MVLDPERVARMKRALEEGIPFVQRSGVTVLALEPGYAKMMVPFAPNVNHVGTMYAGALFTLAEMPGGAIFMTTFDAKRFYPIVKDMQIRFRRPARTDVTVEVRLDAATAADIQARAERDGKADYAWDCELRDADGEVVATSHNLYQLRKRADLVGS
jgi:acyl-coenzyme A thioesterase PaaI-like protein